MGWPGRAIVAKGWKNPLLRAQALKPGTLQWQAFIPVPGSTGQEPGSWCASDRPYAHLCIIPEACSLLRGPWVQDWGWRPGKSSMGKSVGL